MTMQGTNHRSVHEQITTIHVHARLYMCLSIAMSSSCMWVHACLTIIPNLCLWWSGSITHVCTCIHNTRRGGFPMNRVKLDHTMSSSLCTRITLLRDKQLLRRYELPPDKIHTCCITWGVPGCYLSGSSPPQSDSYHHSLSLTGAAEITLA